MKRNWISILAAPLIAAVACVSCQSSSDKEKTSEAPKGYKSFKSGAVSDSEYSQWMSKADLRIIHENNKQGDYFACIEGRNNGGMLEYRHVTRPFPSDKFAEWAVFWGLSSDEFYQIDLKMLRAGFKRENTQVFEDATGAAYHQVVWIKPQASASAASQ